MSGTSLTAPRLIIEIGEFSPAPLSLPLQRPQHWLDIARPIYRFMAHPLTMFIAWGVVFVLSALSCLGWLFVILL